MEYLRQLPADTAGVLYGRLPPLRVHTTPWWSDRHLRAMVEDTRDPINPAGGGPRPRSPSAGTTPRPDVDSMHDGIRQSRTNSADADTGEDQPNNVVDLSSRSTWLDHHVPPATAGDGEEPLTGVQGQGDDAAAAVAAQHALNASRAQPRRQSS